VVADYLSCTDLTGLASGADVDANAAALAALEGDLVALMALRTPTLSTPSTAFGTLLLRRPSLWGRVSSR